MNSRLTILVGISGSGKSTWAHNQWEKDPLNVVIVSRDKIRELLFGYTEKSIINYWSKDEIFSMERIVTQYEDTLINEALQSGKDVIVDSTHLKRPYLERFSFWNVSTEIKTLNTTVRQAISRDMKRTRQVGDEIIIKQYAQFKSLFQEVLDKPLDFSVKTLDNKKYLPSCLIFDIDGTIADKGDRNPYDWKRVGQDYLHEDVVHTLDYAKDTNHVRKPAIIICTGRELVKITYTKMLYIR